MNGRSAICAAEYEVQMDSFSNVVYRNLLAISPGKSKTALTSNQNRWLKKKKQLFRIMDKKLDEMGDSDHPADVENFMPVYAKKAEYIKMRVLYLINKLPM